MSEEQRIVVPSGSPLRGVYVRSGVPEGTHLVPPDKYLVVSEFDHFEEAMALIAVADWGKNGVFHCSNKHRYQVKASDLKDLAVGPEEG
jgi:hypothetical protein